MKEADRKKQAIRYLRGKMESRELEEDEIARLNAIGFPWKVQKQEKKKILIDGRLAELWDEEKNGPVELAKKYNNYWYKCPNCGCEWQRALWIAAESNLCPACEGGLTLAKGWNDLKTVYPDIAADWDYEKNGGLKPSDVMARSMKKVWWKCRTCHGSWQCEVSYRVQDKKVCPYCKKKKLLKGFNDLKSQYPEIAKDYLPELNDGVPADEVIVKYTVKVRWRCHICGHEWICAVGLRTREKNPCGCAVCGAKRAGRKISKRAVEERGALSVFNPALAANWDYKKNGGLEPDSPEFRTNQKYWFICKVCGRSYQTRATITRKPVCCKNPYLTFDGKHWCYPDDLESRIDNAEEYTVPRKTAVRCLETGKMYESIADASRDTGINHNSIRSVARGDRHKAGGYTWEYVNPAPDKRDNRGCNQPTAKKVRCAETGNQFVSLSDAARAVGLRNGNSIRRAIDRGGTAGGYHWEYLDEKRR